MQTIQFIQTTPEQLKTEIAESVKIQLADFLKNYGPIQQKEYLTRKNVADMFDVDISTVHNWCKSKRLNPWCIGARVYFLRSEVENSLKPINK